MWVVGVGLKWNPLYNRSGVLDLFCFDRGTVSGITIIRSYPSFAADGRATALRSVDWWIE